LRIVLELFITHLFDNERPELHYTCAAFWLQRHTSRDTHPVEAGRTFCRYKQQQQQQQPD